MRHPWLGLLPLMALGACCYDPYDLELSLAPDVPVCGAFVYWEWNGVTEPPAGYFPVLIRSDGLHDGEPILELFDSTGAPVSVPREVDEDARCRDGCPLTTTRFDIAGLAPGDYAVVVRRSRVPGENLIGLRTVEIPWATFEGEDALVSTLRIR